jgi:hypothetical protein
VASNCLMRLLNTPSSGCVFALFHQVRVTLAVELEEVELLLEVEPVLELLPLLHAAAAVAVVTASAMAASARLLRIVVS